MADRLVWIKEAVVLPEHGQHGLNCNMLGKRGVAPTATCTGLEKHACFMCVFLPFGSLNLSFWSSMT